MTTLSATRVPAPTATSRRSASSRALWMLTGLVLLGLAAVASGGPDLAIDGQALARRELQSTSSAPAHGSGVIVPGPEPCTVTDAAISPKRI